MSWRERAVPVAAVADKPSASGGWRTRAVPVTDSASEVSEWESLGRGARQGATLGFSDEASGVIGAYLKHASRHGSQPGVSGAVTRTLGDLLGIETRYADQMGTLADVYRQGRDSERMGDARAREANPRAYFAGEVAGAAVLPMPGMAAARGLGFGARLKQAGKAGAAIGAGYGLGSSNANDFAGAATDTGLGAAFGATGGAAASAAGIGLSRLLDRIRSRAASGIREAVAQETAAQTALAEKSIRGAQGEYRSAVQSASRDLEVLAREATDLPPGPLKDAVSNYLKSAEGLAVREQVTGNKLVTAPERIAEMTGKKLTLESLVAGKDDAVQLMTAEALRDPMRKHVAPRVLTLGHRLLPLLGPAVGGTVGGAEGAWIGAGAGALMSITQGAPGRIIRNLKDKPAVRKAFWEKVLKASGGATPTNASVVRALEIAADQGEQAFDVAVARLAETMPAANDILRAVAQFGAEETKQPEMQATRLRYLP